MDDTINITKKQLRDIKEEFNEQVRKMKAEFNKKIKVIQNKIDSRKLNEIRKKIN